MPKTAATPKKKTSHTKSSKSDSARSLRSLVHDISYQPVKRTELFLSLPLPQQIKVLFSLSKHVQFQLLTKLTKDELLPILEKLDPDEATDVLQLFPKARQDKIIAELTEIQRQSVSLLLQFDPKTAAGLMNIDYVQVDAEDSISEVAKQVKVHEKRTGKLPTILVIDDGKLLGTIPGHELAYALPTHKSRKFVKKVTTISHTANYEKVLKFFRRNPHNKVVVLGKNNGVIGVIYSDDILNILQENEAATLYDFAGVSDEETIYDSAKRKISFRYKWLVLNLGTSFLAASIVSLFEDTISKNVLLAVYMPIVAGMGGNAGTQTLAVMVRSLATTDPTPAMIWRAVINEVGAGLAHGTMNGLIVGGIVMFFNHDPLVAITLAFAMMVNLTVSATFGTLVPVTMKKLGKDPAASATIFITTATDVFGFFAFLGLATILLAR